MKESGPSPVFSPSAGHSKASGRSRLSAPPLGRQQVVLPQVKVPDSPHASLLFQAPVVAGPTEDEMGMLLHQLKEGGVSITGQTQPLTHDHFRRSFIRRNKNPIINDKAHSLRALQSTLKARPLTTSVLMGGTGSWGHRRAVELLNLAVSVGSELN